MAMGRGLTICCLVTVGSSGALNAQEFVSPPVGSRVRVHSPLLTPNPLVGTLTAIHQRSLGIRRAGDDQSRTIALGDISRLEKSVQRSRKKKGALVGLGVGFAVGFAGAAILGGLYGTGGDSDSLLVWGSIYGAAVAPLGAVVGAAVAPGEQWAEAAIDQISSGHVHAQQAAHSRITIRPLVGRQYGFILEASF